MQLTNRDDIAAAILERLERDAAAIRADFARPRGGPRSRFATIDGLLPDDTARQVFAAFPRPDEMRLLSSFREKKYTSKALARHDPLVAEVLFAFQDPRVVSSVAALTGLTDAHADPQLYAGGISAMARGHFLNPHLDNSHDLDQTRYRVLNLLYYCTPDWKAEWGGNLELWNEDVTRAVEIPSLFNRLVLMATNDASWHSVNAVRHDGTRCCVSNYYFSPHSPNGYDTTHVTYFRARPDQPVRRLLTDADSTLRTWARRLRKRGFSKTDVFDARS